MAHVNASGPRRDRKPPSEGVSEPGCVPGTRMMTRGLTEAYRGRFEPVCGCVNRTPNTAHNQADRHMAVFQVTDRDQPIVISDGDGERALESMPFSALLLQAQVMATKKRHRELG